MTPETFRASSLMFISPFDASGKASRVTSELARAGGPTFTLVAATFVEAWVQQYGAE
jgi:hypothetical protein